MILISSPSIVGIVSFQLKKIAKQLLLWLMINREGKEDLSPNFEMMAVSESLCVSETNDCKTKPASARILS